MADYRILNEKQLAKRLEYWKKKLGLSDWKIDANICREKNMGPDRAGEVDWLLEQKYAIISLLDPIDYPDSKSLEQDMENTLVHELLHLHHAPISDYYSKDCDQYNLYEEWAINAVANALVSVERKEH